MQLISILLLLMPFNDNIKVISEIDSYELLVQDSLCEGGGVFCPDCETAIMNGCFISDSLLLLNGIISCTPEYVGPGPQTDQPSPLCFGAGVPHNMSWFAFVASGVMAEVTIVPFQCSTESGAIGLQSGVYDFCSPEGGTCLGGQPFCSTGMDPIEYVVENMVIGNTYYLFVDGCNGAECDFEIVIEPSPSCLLDTPKSLNLNSSCPPVGDTITYCNISEFDLEITHFGDGPTFNGIYDNEDAPFNPALKLNYRWYVNPPFMGDDTIIITKEENGISIIDLLKDNPEDINYEICLRSVESECDIKTCDDCCLNIILKDCGDDYDQDGYNTDEDCNDCDATINPGAEEIVENEIDENCDGDLNPTSTSSVALDGFEIYPNPFADYINIHTSVETSFIIELYNTEGILIETLDSQKSISMSHLSAGTYVLKIKFPSKDSVIVRKILKL